MDEAYLESTQTITGGYYMGFPNRNISGVFSVVVIVVLFLVTCSVDRSTTGPTQDTVKVSGRIISLYCPGSIPPIYSTDNYAVDWNGRAKIAFIDSAGQHDSCFIDDSSDYTIDIPSGTYDILLETDHALPQLYPGINITADTTIDISFRLEWLTRDTVSLHFVYYDAADSIGEINERAFLLFLGDRTNNMLRIDQVTRIAWVYYEIEPPWMSAIYRVPISSLFRSWQVFAKCDSVFEEYPNFFPEGTYVGDRGYVCFYGNESNPSDREP